MDIHEFMSSVHVGHEITSVRFHQKTKRYDEFAQPTTPEKFLDRAIAEDLIDFKGEGKNEKIAYSASNNHTERWSDPEKKFLLSFTLN